MTSHAQSKEASAANLQPKSPPNEIPSLPTPIFDNQSGLDALFFNMLNAYGNGFHVLVAKTAFQIGPCGADGYATLQAIDPPMLLATQDRHFDDDFQQSTLQESDLAPYKPKCDVIVVADAHAPGAQALPQFAVQLQVLAQRPAVSQATNKPLEDVLINKQLHIFGPRSFQYQGQAWSLSKPQPVKIVPLRYEYALGGGCMVKGDEEAAKHVPNSERLPAPHDNGAMAWQVAQGNPLGLGFCRQWYWQATQINSFAAPQIEYPQVGYDVAAFERCLRGEEIAAPAGLGSIGRAWLPRRQLVGTVQEKAQWHADEVPALPRDFDFGYWNAAPLDQQCRYLTGGEVIRLSNLCPQHHPASHLDAQQNNLIEIELPKHACVLMAAVEPRSAANPSDEIAVRIENLLIDTVHINLLEQRLELTWRFWISCDDDIASMRLIYATRADQLARLAELQQAAQAASPKAGHSHG